MSRTKTLTTTAAVLAAAVAMAAPPARAESAALPQSVKFEHEEIIARLTTLTQHPAPVGPAARKVLDIVVPHFRHDEEAVLPPLALLPQIVQGKVSPDMKWALPMIDRVRAEQADNIKVHEQITAELMLLFAAADAANDEEGTRLAREISGDLLHDDEVTEPTVLMIGDYLRAKMPS